MSEISLNQRVFLKIGGLIIEVLLYLINGANAQYYTNMKTCANMLGAQWISGRDREVAGLSLTGVTALCP